jgi:tRNA dimethylallyltransferase
MILPSFTGYREFSRYLSSSGQSEKAFEEGLEEMKRSTRRYAQRQIKWIKNKTLPAIEATRTNAREDNDVKKAHMYLLDASGMDSVISTNCMVSNVEFLKDIGPAWTTVVLGSAVKITHGV